MSAEKLSNPKIKKSSGREPRAHPWLFRPAGEHALLHGHGQTEDGPDELPSLALLLSPGGQLPLLTAQLQCSGLSLSLLCLGI